MAPASDHTSALPPRLSTGADRSDPGSHPAHAMLPKAGSPHHHTEPCPVPNTHSPQPTRPNPRRAARVRAALIVLLMLLVVTGCTVCPLLGGRRSVAEATAMPDAVTEEGTPAPEPTPDAATLEQALADGAWETRMAAAHAVPQRLDIPLPDRVAMLSEALEREISQPSAEPQPDHSYLPVSGVVRLRLVRGLGSLGDDALAMLRDRAAEAEGDARASYLIALGYLGDKQVVAELCDVVQESEDPVLRMDAARVLGLLGNRQAIPALQTALADPFVSEGRDSLGTYSIYPVREQAAGALKLLGVAVERDGDTFTARP